MSYVITRSEYLTIDSVPLSTPAWETLDLSELNDGPTTRGEDLVLPQIRGASPRPRNTESRTVNIPIVIFGDKSPTGSTHANPREGLLSNINELKRAIRPPRTASTITRNLTWVRPGDDVFALVHISPQLSLEYLNPTTARGVLEITIPAGILQSTTLTTVSQYVDPSPTFSFNVGGSAEVIASTINIPGEANFIKIVSNTTGFELEYDYPVVTGLQLITAGFFALDGTTNVSGKVTTKNTNLWLPLVPGTNSWTVTRDGAPTTIMTIQYRAAYL